MSKTTTTSKEWIGVDIEGLLRLVDRVGRERVILEPVANTIDEDGVTRVEITLVPIEGRRGVAAFTITDNSPTGFRQLSDAYTLFAKSYKTTEDHVEKRGRFNSGDKRFLSICEAAQITTTTGTVVFTPEGRTTTGETRPEGSRLDAVVKLSSEQRKAAIDLIQQIIVPEGVTMVLNGDVLPGRTPVHTFEATLPTQFQKDGEWRDTARKTTVRLFTPMPGDTPTIFELGMPVVEEKDSRWHVDVGQKVPVGEERNNITPSYLRKLRTAVLDNSYQLLGVEDANSRWVRDAIPAATPEALQAVLNQRFGEKHVVADPRDPEANKLAAAQGFTVINPKSFSRDEWSNIRAHELVKPAGQVTPSPKIASNPEGEGILPLEGDKVTVSMQRVIIYTERFAREALGIEITARVFPRIPGEHMQGGHAAASYGGRRLSFSLQALGHRWFDEPNQVKVDALIIHELAHEWVSDHLSHKFVDKLCEIGAQAKAAADAIGHI